MVFYVCGVAVALSATSFWFAMGTSSNHIWELFANSTRSADQPRNCGLFVVSLAWLRTRGTWQGGGAASRLEKAGSALVGQGCSERECSSEEAPSCEGLRVDVCRRPSAEADECFRVGFASLRLEQPIAERGDALSWACLRIACDTGSHMVAGIKYLVYHNYNIEGIWDPLHGAHTVSAGNNAKLIPGAPKYCVAFWELIPRRPEYCVSWLPLRFVVPGFSGGGKKRNEN